MYIGSLTSENSPVSCNYSYFFRGTSVPLKPDLVKEEYDSEIYTEEYGKLFLGGPIGWKTDTLLDVGVDISFTFSKKCFIDHIVLNQEESSSFKMIEIIKKIDEREKIISTYSAQTGKTVTDEEVKIFVGDNSDNIVIRVYSAVRNLIIKELNIFGALFYDDNLFPIPEYKLNKSEEKISFDKFKTISAEETNKGAVYAANLLEEKLRNLRGKNIEIKSNVVANSIIFKEFDTSDELFGVKEAFSLISEADFVTIYANDKRGFIYGAEALMALTEDGMLPLITIKDKPAREFRGIHIYSLPERKDLEFFLRFVKYFLIPLRYNAMVLEVCGGMRYESHPEITDKWIEACENYKAGNGPVPSHSGCVMGGTVYEKNEVSKIVEYIKDLGIDVIPEVQSLAHVQYITNAHPEIAEVAEEETDVKKVDYSVGDQLPTGDIPHSYCPSNEKSYEIIFDLIDEIIEVFKPEKYVHMGHDEAYGFGTCPVCKNKNKGDLLAYHINRVYECVAKHNLKMMIWSDMLQNITSERTSYLHLDTMSAINKIPKDIVMCDFIWYFNLEHDIEDHLLKHGFNVVIGNMYSSLYPRYDTRIVKPGMLGGLTATWVDTTEKKFAEDGKMYETIYTANMLWNGEYRSDLRLTYNECIKKLMPSVRSNVRNEKIKKEEKNIPFENSVNIPSDISNAGEEYNLNSMLRISGNEEVIINANGKFDTVSFLHATEKNTKRICWQPLVKVGEYKVIYEDGSSEVIFLEYGGNICELRRGYAKPLNEPYYRHQGYLTTYIADPEICSKNDLGEDITIYRYRWINPKPNLRIVQITAKKYNDNDADILLFSVDAN